MVKVNVISGFLGAGKTTLIKKLLTGRLRNEKVVLLENEYGEIGIDGGFMKDAGITVTELNAGCICCTLAGDFQAAVDQLIDTYHPDRILVEPTGVGKLSEILSAVEKAKERHPDIETGGSATVVDAGKCRMYMKNFGEFFLDQVKSASTVIFSRTQLLDADRVEKSRQLIAEAHPDARIITTPWDEMEPDFMLDVIENGKPIWFAPLEDDDDDDDEDEDEHEHHHHHDHDDDHEHEHHHDHHHDDDDDDDDDDEHHEHHHHDTIIMATTITIITTTITARTSTTRTRCSATSAWRRRSAMSRTRSAASWLSSPTRRNTAACCAPRASCRTPRAAGSSLTMCPARSTCATAARTTPAACA